MIKATISGIWVGALSGAICFFAIQFAVGSYRLSDPFIFAVIAGFLLFSFFYSTLGVALIGIPVHFLLTAIKLTQLVYYVAAGLLAGAVLAYLSWAPTGPNFAPDPFPQAIPVSLFIGSIAAASAFGLACNRMRGTQSSA